MLPGLMPPAGVPDGDVHGFVQRILFADVEKGHMVLRVSASNGDGIIMRGHGDPVSIGDEVSATGSWEVNPKVGRQFNADFISANIPETTNAILSYLSRGAVEGIGKRTAERLARHFGDQLPDVMNLATTLAAAGIPEKKTRKISEHWELRTKHGWLLTFLYAHRLGPATAQKIIEKYGDSATRVVGSEPYRLAEEVQGIGFKTADRIAMSQGREKDDPMRLRAGILHSLSNAGREGHCALVKDILVSNTADLLQVSRQPIETVITKMLDESKIVEDELAGQAVIYSKAVHACEIEVAENLIQRIGPRLVPVDIRNLIRTTAHQDGIELDPHQVEAIEQALCNNVSIITGGPGTGKTLLIRCLIAILKIIEPNCQILAAAPTGRAAKRLEESTGHPGQTAHRMLEWSPSPPRGFTRNAEHPLDADVLILDETSMIDIWLSRDILRALNMGARLIIVGDVDQLSSIGAGNVLADCISSGVIPVTRLTKIYRQGPGSGINVAAQRVNQGNMPQLTKPRFKSDMWGITVDEPADLIEKLKRLMTDVMPQIGFDPLQHVQVVTPGHQNETGTINLNRVLQECMNPLAPGGTEVEHKGRVFRLRDRVIHTRNNYDLDAFNGDVGNIIDISDVPGEDVVLTVDYDGKRVAYEKSDLDQLDHAYAVTIHKLQGSEFPVIIVVCTTQHYIMLCRNLIYTGITRARKRCVVIGSERALRIAVKTEPRRRITGLAQRLAGSGLAASQLPSSC